MYSAALALSAGSYCTGSLPWTTPCPAGTYQVVRHACMPACYVLLLTLLLALLFRLITYPFLTRSCTPSNIFLHSTLLPPPLTPTTPSQPFSGASSVSACLPCPLLPPFTPSYPLYPHYPLSAVLRCLLCERVFALSRGVRVRQCEHDGRHHHLL